MLSTGTYLTARSRATIVLVAIEPAMYREVLAGALARRGSGIRAALCDPAELGREVARLGPDVVFCPEATAGIRARVGCWVEVPFAGASLDATVGSGGGVVGTFEGIELEDLLGVVDGAAVGHPARGEPQDLQLPPRERAAVAFAVRPEGAIQNPLRHDYQVAPEGSPRGRTLPAGFAAVSAASVPRRPRGGPHRGEHCRGPRRSPSAAR